jgi:hypothetical protein
MEIFPHNLPGNQTVAASIASYCTCSGGNVAA